MSEDEIEQLLVDHVIMDDAGVMVPDAGEGAMGGGDRQGVMPGQLPDDDTVMLQFMAPGEDPQVEGFGGDEPLHGETTDPPVPALEELSDNDGDGATDSSGEEDVAVRVEPFRRVSSCISY